MATATWLHSTSTHIALLSGNFLRPTVSGNFLRPSRFLPTAAGILSRSSQSRREMTTVCAQAKRVLPIKEDKAELASSDDLQFEAPLKIVEYPDPVLRAKNKRIGLYDDNLKKLVHHMFDVMYKTDGIGLSAPQVGMNVQLMVFNPAGERGVGEEIVLINPRVYKYSSKKIPFNEGCLSFPGIYGDVVRPESLRVDAYDISGARYSVSLSGLPARVFQHEFDHLKGVLFFDRMTEEVLNSIRAELLALEKKYEERTGLSSPEKIETVKGIEVSAGVGKLRS